VLVAAVPLMLKVERGPRPETIEIRVLRPDHGDRGPEVTG
jgi:hypothetical protein